MPRPYINDPCCDEFFIIHRGLHSYVGECVSLQRRGLYFILQIFHHAARCEAMINTVRTVKTKHTDKQIMHRQNYDREERHIPRAFLEACDKRNLNVCTAKRVITINGCCAGDFSRECIIDFVTSGIFKTSKIKF